MRTPPQGGELLLFMVLLACGAICVEATRRLGMPAGVSRDLLSAWWLPVALLPPPVYALIAPIPLSVLVQLRIRRSAIYRRAYGAAALGLAGAATLACALSPVLLFVALPPVILLLRSLIHQQLRAAARTDAKTGLLNAAAWQREADTEFNRVIRIRGRVRVRDSLALLLIDIDHFKRVNDVHGHLVGDEVLAGLAETLRQQVRDLDVVGRFGGEEFVVLLPGADAAKACKIAERLREQVSATAILSPPARYGSLCRSD